MSLLILLPLVTLLVAGCDDSDTTRAVPDPRRTARVPTPDSTAAAYVTANVGLSAEDQRAGVVALFDGETLFGWRTDEVSGNWRVKDGTIVCDKGSPEILYTSVPWADFDLRCEFKVDPGGNSGVFVRSLRTIQDVATDCYEVNIAAEHPEEFTTGSLVGRLRATGVPAGDDGQWHRLRVVCDGSRVRTFVDGEDAADLMGVGGLADRRAGYIGLQHRLGAVAFRRITLRPRNMDRLLPPDEGLDDVPGWTRTTPVSKTGKAARFAFQPTPEGVLATGGPGFLQSERTFADFVAQLRVTVRGDELNSGLFFRAEPGTPEAPSNGYEVQISNAYIGDRTKPKDFGSGGIFRRQAARRVSADDRTTAVLTLVADGPDMMTWVNGDPVVQFTDTRDPDPNPRRGTRLEAGHLILQAHDPTTSVLFEDLQVAELPKELAAGEGGDGPAVE